MGKWFVTHKNWEIITVLVQIEKMLPCREFFGMKDYLKRLVHDEFLEKMPPSFNELTKGREFIPKNPRLVVSEGFYNKANY